MQKTNFMDLDFLCVEWGVELVWPRRPQLIPPCDPHYLCRAITASMYIHVHIAQQGQMDYFPYGMQVKNR